MVSAICYSGLRMNCDVVFMCFMSYLHSPIGFLQFPDVVVVLRFYMCSMMVYECGCFPSVSAFALFQWFVLRCSSVYSGLYPVVVMCGVLLFPSCSLLCLLVVLRYERSLCFVSYCSSTSFCSFLDRQTCRFNMLAGVNLGVGECESWKGVRDPIYMVWYVRRKT